MPRLFFGATKDPNTIPPAVEAVLRKELDLVNPISYQVERKDMSSVGASEVFKFAGKAVGKELVSDIIGQVVPPVVGGIASAAAAGAAHGVADAVLDRKEKPGVSLVCIVHFHIIQPSQVELDAYVVRQKLPMFVGHLYYNCKLAKSVSSEVALIQDKKAGTVEFKGDPQVSRKLNGNTGFVKRASDLTRGELKAHPYHIILRDPMFKIIPQPSGSLLKVHTTTKYSPLSGSFQFDVKSFFSIVTLLEALL